VTKRSQLAGWMPDAVPAQAVSATDSMRVRSPLLGIHRAIVSKGGLGVGTQ